MNITLHPLVDPPLFQQSESICAPLSFMARAGIIVMNKLGFDKADIVRWIGHDVRTIDHWISHYEEHGNVEDEQRSGRPLALVDETNKAIVSLAEERKFITPKDIRSELQLSVSTRTIRRRLDEQGLFGRVARISFPFTEDHIEQRLAFANTHKDWNETKWDTVLFSDETYIVLGGTGQIWVQRPEDTAFLSEYMAQRDPFPEKIGVWGCFSSQGIGAIRIIDGTMDSEFLTDTFYRFMVPAARHMWPVGQWYLLQDNAPYHASRETQTWLHNHGIDCINFPPYSPDLNPIENLWAYLKRRIELRFPSNTTELKQILVEEWESTDPNFLITLAHSMINRCKAVIVCRGFKTKY
jgi:transposase